MSTADMHLIYDLIRKPYNKSACTWEAKDPENDIAVSPKTTL